MKLFFLRILPILTGLLALLASALQWILPAWYPWPLVLFGVWYAVAGSLLVWRSSWAEGIQEIVPSLLAMAAIALNFLLVESSVERWFLTFFLAGISALVLELLFLLNFAPPRYPVHSLSRVNEALVFVTGFFLASTLSGFVVFLQFPLATVFGVWFLAAACLYYFTSSATASPGVRWRWTLFGAWLGLHIALLEILLPVSMMVHGALAVCLLAIPIHLRHQEEGTMVMRRLWRAGLLFAGCYIAILISSRWI